MSLSALGRIRPSAFIFEVFCLLNIFRKTTKFSVVDLWSMQYLIWLYFIKVPSNEAYIYILNIKTIGIMTGGVEIRSTKNSFIIVSQTKEEYINYT